MWVYSAGINTKPVKNQRFSSTAFSLQTSMGRLKEMVRLCELEGRAEAEWDIALNTGYSIIITTE